MGKKKIKTQSRSLWYDPTHAIKSINMKMQENAVTSIIGPSGCGKSTFIRILNRMNDLINNCRITGFVFIGEEEIYSPIINVVELRKKVGMVFQKPNPFPMSVYDNVAYGPGIHGEKNKENIDDIVEWSLKSADLWDEVKDRLDKPALDLSGGQQQRLCIARTLAVKPEVILFDEPCSALDPISTGKIEELIYKLKKDYTIVIVTHNMQQAARISNYTAYFLMGELIEFGETKQIFENPREKSTEDYITGRFG